jgi:hypothetical protein
MISTGIFPPPGQEPLTAVAFFVATGAECNQILRRIPSELAPWFYVVNLQVLHGAAVLAPPAISFQHLFSQNVVIFGLQFESWLPAWAR